MAYEKQNWATGQAGGTPLSADRLMHMEHGIARTDDVFYISGNVGGSSSVSIAAGDSKYFQVVRVYRPVGKNVVLTKARFYLGDFTTWRLYVYSVGGLYGREWTSSSYMGDEDPMATMLTVPLANGDIRVAVKNTDNTSRSLPPWSGWSLTLELVDQ